MAKKRSTFFEDAFSAKEINPIKERVQSESIVLADVKTNVIVGGARASGIPGPKDRLMRCHEQISDEFTFITELSYHLSTRYQRPVSSIVVCLQHGACMLFGGTFDPAYVMTICALPSQVMPVTNKRNAALVQRHMEEAIGVGPARGFLRFVATTEENVACNGRTMAGEIEDLEKEKSIGGNAATDDATSIVSRRSKARGKLSARVPAPYPLLTLLDYHIPGQNSLTSHSPLET